MKKLSFILLGMVAIVSLAVIIFVVTKRGSTQPKEQSTEEIVQSQEEWNKHMQEKAQEAEEEYEAQLPEEYKEQFPEDYKYFDLSNSWVTEEDRKKSEEVAKWNREHPIYFSDLGNYEWSYYDPDFIAPDEWYHDLAAGDHLLMGLYKEGKLVILDDIKNSEIYGRHVEDNCEVVFGDDYGKYPEIIGTFSKKEPGLYVYAYWPEDN